MAHTVPFDRPALGTFFTLCIITIMIVLQSKNSRTPKFLLPVAVLMMVLAIGVSDRPKAIPVLSGLIYLSFSIWS